MPTPPLTRSIGIAERSMRSLLERELSRSGLSFIHWTALVFTSDVALSVDQIAQRQLAGHIVVAAPETREAVDRLLQEGLLSADPGDMLRHTGKGRDLFAKLGQAVENITASLYGDLPPADLDATHRTLTEIASRAARLLSVR